MEVSSERCRLNGLREGPINMVTVAVLLEMLKWEEGEVVVGLREEF